LDGKNFGEALSRVEALSLYWPVAKILAMEGVE
jgi:hypothetical protein